MSLIAALITVSGPGCVNCTTYLLVSELEDEIETVLVFVFFKFRQLFSCSPSVICCYK